jgi:hypothetical protein
MYSDHVERGSGPSVNADHQPSQLPNTSGVATIAKNRHQQKGGQIWAGVDNLAAVGEFAAGLPKLGDKQPHRNPDGLTAVLAAPCFAALVNGEAGDQQADGRVEPPQAQEHVGE